MIIIQDKLVSDEIIQEHFLCNLEACKGACCWEGDGGAPLEEEELLILDQIYEVIQPFLSPAGQRVIAEEGTHVYDEEGETYATPLIDNGPCAYMTLDQTGTAKCGIEQAWQAGKINFQKPISCHLYPIRVRKNETVRFEALNYDRWDICSAACEKGKELQVPIYQFVKDAIIRKYGEDFYEELEAAAENLHNK